jgi:hypothetical protein
MGTGLLISDMVGCDCGCMRHEENSAEKHIDKTKVGSNQISNKALHNFTFR